MTTYTVLILEKNSVQIADLTPDTTYIVRVQVVGSEVNPGSHSVEHEFQTSPLGTNMIFYIYIYTLNVCVANHFFLIAQLSLRSRTNLRW